MVKPSVVLIVEDDALLAEMALEMIEEAGVAAVAVDSVDAALDYLKEHADDVALERPYRLPRNARFMPKPWKAPEVISFVEQASRSR